ncbi:MAG: substrate-binding domain-containing protein, partial [Alphaproteobacteria bacterium]|nr:substrate-binding domain-containing protein [Alphaproteobacteria bacterium]
MRNFIIALAIGVTGALFALPSSAAAQERFILVSHAPDSDSWWNTIKNAIRDAGQQLGVDVEYRNPPTGDIADMARIIEQSAAAGPDGIITTIADFDVLGGAITSAVDRGIPVITINSGTHEQSESLGALLHVGQPEYDAGLGAGKRAKKEGNVTKFLCVNHFFTNPVSV